MASNFSYASVEDLHRYINRISDFESKRQIFPDAFSSDRHIFYNAGAVGTNERLFVNGEEMGADAGETPDANKEWEYVSNTNKLTWFNDGYTATTVKELIFEIGYDFDNYLKQMLVDASLELHNYVDARYSTPFEKQNQLDIDTAVDSSGTHTEYDPIIIKSVCYIAAANLIRAKEGSSEDADYYMSLVTNPERTGLVDRLNVGIYKLSHEVDGKDKNGKIVFRSVSGTMQLVELTGEYSGEGFEVLNVEIETTGAYGVSEFKVWHFGSDKIKGAVTSAVKITGTLQHLYGGLYGRFKGASGSDGDYWEIDVYGSHRKQTNKSNATIEMVR